MTIQSGCRTSGRMAVGRVHVKTRPGFFRFYGQRCRQVPGIPTVARSSAVGQRTANAGHPGSPLCLPGNSIRNLLFGRSPAGSADRRPFSMRQPTKGPSTTPVRRIASALRKERIFLSLELIDFAIRQKGAPCTPAAFLSWFIVRPAKRRLKRNAARARADFARDYAACWAEAFRRLDSGEISAKERARQ